MSGVDLVVYEIARARIEIGDGGALADEFYGDAMPIPHSGFPVLSPDGHSRSD
jgi:hypothetical protein